ncbi:MAG: hypothetical protein GF353_29600 [Candidatus Lokiarchaeota archaeon]|nr:hypothetical protein [Candidatus Lokiarchaeota archaeon]
MMDEFPEIYRGVAGEYADLYSKYLEPPKEFFFMSFLTCLGSIVSARIKVNSELKSQPRFYTLLLGESADDRKSTAMNKTLELFDNANIEFNYCGGVGSAEGLHDEFIKITKNQGLVLVYDEFSSFVSKCKIRSSVLLPCVNSLFDNNFYENKTKTSKFRSNDIYLSLLGATTIETYNQIWDSRFTRIGFNNRLFLVPATSKKRIAFPDKIPAKLKHALIMNIVEILDFIEKENTIHIEPDAKLEFEIWYNNKIKSVHTKRLDEYIRRLMVILAVNEKKNSIDINIAKDAIELGKWQLGVRQLHDPIDADNTIAKLEESIRRCLKNKRLKDYELKQKVNYSRYGTWMYEIATKNLERANEIKFNAKQKVWEIGREFFSQNCSQ